MDEPKKNISIGGVSLANMKSSAALSQKSMRRLSRMRSRRMSYGFSGVPGIRPVERTSQVAIEFKRPPLLFFPTYQLDSREPFQAHVVKKAIDESLDEHFTDHKYNGQESPALALRLAGELMKKVKELQFNRYRVLAIVTLAQKRAQSYNNAITFLWDHERDNYVDVVRETTTAFIQVAGLDWLVLFGWFGNGHLTGFSYYHENKALF